MSTRDELEQAIDQADHFYVMNQPRGTVSAHIADVLIAEGWRKMPSRDEVARWHDPDSFLPYDGEEIALEFWPDDEATRDRYRTLIEDRKAEGRIAAYRFADSVLALMDRGQ